MESAMKSRDTARAMSEENVEATRRSIEAYRRGDYAGASAHLAPDVVWAVGQELPAHGPAAVQEMWKRWDGEWDQLEVLIRVVPEPGVPDELALVHVRVAPQLPQRGGPAGSACDGLEGMRFMVCAGLDTTYVAAGGTATPQTQATANVQCPPDKPRMVGGGVSVDGVTANQGNAAIAASKPAFSNGGWQAWIDNYNGAANVPFSVHAVCVASL
jgi:SnoaL-like domain